MHLKLVLLVFLFSTIGFSLDDPNQSRVLKMGKVPANRVALGTLLSIAPGFGVGHAVQGRYESDGWVFTAGEGLGVGMMAIEMASNGGVFPGDGVMGILGLSTFAAFKIWEIFDALFGSIHHNNYYDKTKLKMTSEAPSPQWAAFPVAGGLGFAVAF